MIRVDADTVAVQTNRSPVLVQLPGPTRPAPEVYRVTRAGRTTYVAGPIPAAAYTVGGRTVERVS